MSATAATGAATAVDHWHHGPAGRLDEHDRAAVWRALGATPGETEELLVYARNSFDTALDRVNELPLPDEPFVDAWARYAARAATEGVVEVLRGALVQLRFPISAGISTTETYRAATQRGIMPSDSTGTPFADPAGVHLFLHPTAAGRIPVIVARHRDDFVTLVQALTRRNEPMMIPSSMGACVVAGYNNWERVRRLRAQWSAREGADSDAGWRDEFARVIPNKETYQDRFIVLSSGPYSAVSAEAMGMHEADWLSTSLSIRLEHECAHYFTRRVFGSMRNSLLDELIADHAGITAAAGRYRADWFLRFVGLEGSGELRAGGRMENYRGDPPLSAGAFAVLCAGVRKAARRLEALDEPARPARTRTLDDSLAVARSITMLAGCSLEWLASPWWAAAIPSQPMQ